MSDESPTIDYDQIEFPSDKITFKQLRALARRDDKCEDLFSYLSEHAEGLDVMHFHERQFADLGFAKGIGNPKQIADAITQLTLGWKDNEPDTMYDEALAIQASIELLMCDYQRYGIADGLETTKQLIRRVEDQAAVQARSLLGRF